MASSLLHHTFGPVHDRHSRILILGSMPGEASLTAGEYYAHPRNQFWPIMGILFNAGPDRPYPERLDRLRKQGVALWDVIASCRRRGSLDSAIDLKSVKPNAFPPLLRESPGIHTIAFNGSAAEVLFRRHVIRPGLVIPDDLHLQSLPSTSPAHAAMTLHEKLERWRVGLVG